MTHRSPFCILGLVLNLDKSGEYQQTQLNAHTPLKVKVPDPVGRGIQGALGTTLYRMTDKLGSSVR